MRVLITGARGLLGTAIAREFSADADVRAFDHAALDVTDDHAVATNVENIRPDIVVNCAAYNNVDGAEADPATALRVNAFGVLALARASVAAGAALVHYSSDFVFDGDAQRPYTEDDRPSPRSTYGASKLLGDWFALDHGGVYVLRVESLFGEPGSIGARKGSLGTIIEQIMSGSDVPVFVDRTVSPSYTRDVAAATRAVLTRRPPFGLYHCVNSGCATWAEIAEEAAKLVGRSLRKVPLTLETVALRAKRPRYCALSNARLTSLGIDMPHWKDALRRHVQTVA